MAILETIAIISAITTAGSLAVQAEAADERKDAQEQQSAQEEINQRREARQAIREARGARARAEQVATNQGVSGGSLEGGAVSSVQSQLAGNLAFMQGQANTARNVSERMQSASDLNLLSSGVQAVGSVFNTFAESGAFSSKKPTNTGDVRKLPPI